MQMITRSNETDIATILFTFLLTRILTKGFKSIAIIRAKASGIIIPRKMLRTKTKSMMPKSVTVDLKKKGYFFSI